MMEGGCEDFVSFCEHEDGRSPKSPIAVFLGLMNEIGWRAKWPCRILRQRFQRSSVSGKFERTVSIRKTRGKSF